MTPRTAPIDIAATANQVVASETGRHRPPVMIHDLSATVCAPTSALSGPDGQIRAGGIHGLFVSDARVLSEALLRFGGVEPQPLARLAEGPGLTRFVAVAGEFGDDIPDPTVRVERVRRVTPTGMAEEIRLWSTALTAVRAAITLDLQCDLTPLSLARASQPRTLLAARAEPDELVWTRDATTVTARADGGVAEAGSGRLTWQIDLAAGGSTTVRWWVRADERRPLLISAPTPVEWSRPDIASDDPRLARLVRQSLDDLDALRLAEWDHPDDTFLGAGVPWYLTLFGRDSIWAARMMLPLTTTLAAGTLRTLARRQGTQVDATTGEAPGKIMHELRRDDILADHERNLPATYYGTVDATLLWISLLADAWRWGLPETTVASLLPHMDRALSWLEHHGDPDGDGFIEYVDHTGRGLANQGWKDSGDSVRFHDGRMARPPIALCEVQGYAHRAAVDAAALLDNFGTETGRGGEADRWREYAANLAERFRERFWAEGPLGPFPAMALDADGRRVDSLTSNIGHLLGTGLLSAEEEQTVARLLAAPTLSGAYGLRTMSTLDMAYSPLSYHCGSVWPHDTAITLLGLVAAGAHAAGAELIAGLLAAAEAFDYRLPELYGGDGRGELSRPVPYPEACRPQAWAAAASVTVVQAALGLSADVPNRQVTIRPISALPMGRLQVRGLMVSGHSFDVTVDRDGAVSAAGLPTWLRLCGTQADQPAPVTPARQTSPHHMPAARQPEGDLEGAR